MLISRLLILQVDPQEKKKKKTGRAKRRMQYNRRFVNVVATFGKKRGPNSNAPWTVYVYTVNIMTFDE